MKQLKIHLDKGVKQLYKEDERNVNVICSRLLYTRLPITPFQKPILKLLLASEQSIKPASRTNNYSPKLTPLKKFF